MALSPERRALAGFEQDGGDDAAGQFDASFVLMMLTFREFIPQLLETLGGEEQANPA